MNPQVLINLALLTIMAVVCAIVEARLDVGFTRNMALWTYDENRSNNNPNINGLATWANALITFQNVVPISLYISIEAVRTIQAAFIFFDHEIYHAKSDSPTYARSWNLSDDAGSSFALPFNIKIEVSIELDDFSTMQCRREGDTILAADGQDERTNLDPQKADQMSSSDVELTRFYDSQLQSDIEESMKADISSPTAKQARILNGFFNVLALCHTAIASVNPETGVIDYKAQSPDEYGHLTPRWLGCVWYLKGNGNSDCLCRERVRRP